MGEVWERESGGERLFNKGERRKEKGCGNFQGNGRQCFQTAAFSSHAMIAFLTYVVLLMTKVM